jgi:hypothetical protein
MTTMTEVCKYADGGFNAQMRRRGFAVEKKFYFWRKRGPLFDVFWSEVLSSGVFLGVNLTILSPWVDNENGEFEKFPASYTSIGGTLSDRFPANPIGSYFNVETKADIDATFAEILKLVDTVAVPWFDSVNSYDTYISCIGRGESNPTRQYREKMKRGIALGFEKEADFFSDKYK